MAPRERYTFQWPEGCYGPCHRRWCFIDYYQFSVIESWKLNEWGKKTPQIQLHFRFEEQRMLFELCMKKHPVLYSFSLLFSISINCQFNFHFIFSFVAFIRFNMQKNNIKSIIINWFLSFQCAVSHIWNLFSLLRLSEQL